MWDGEIVIGLLADTVIGGLVDTIAEAALIVTVARVGVGKAAVAATKTGDGVIERAGLEPGGL